MSHGEQHTIDLEDGQVQLLVTEHVEEGPTQPRIRMAFVDNIRSYLTVLVVLHHITMSYGGAAGWPVTTPPTDAVSPVVFILFELLNQSYFMSFFFFLAGLFCPASLDRKGVKRFLWDRFVRLGIPVLVFGFVIYPFVLMEFTLFMYGFPWNYGEAWIHPFITPPYGQVNIGPLWFCEALAYFSLAYVLIRPCCPARPAPAPTPEHVQTQLNSEGESATRTASSTLPLLSRASFVRRVLPWLLLLPILVWAVRIATPMGYYLPYVQFMWSNFVLYVFFFVIGIYAARKKWMMQLPRVSLMWPWIVVVLGIFLLTLMFTLIPGFSVHFVGSMTWESAVYAYWETWFCFGMTILVLGEFYKRWNRQGKFAKFLSSNAYTVYIIHMPLLCLVTGLLRGLEAYGVPSVVLMVINSIITLPLVWGISALVRLIPGLKRVLG